MIKILRAKIEDASILLNIQKEAFKIYVSKYGDIIDNPYDMELDRMEFNIKYRYGRYYKLILDGSIIGGIFGFELDSKNVIKIAQFYILPEYQGKGYGKKLFEYFLSKNKYADTWFVDTILEENKNISFYQKYNFYTVDEEKVSPRVTYVKLKKNKILKKNH